MSSQGDKIVSLSRQMYHQRITGGLTMTQPHKNIQKNTRIFLESLESISFIYLPHLQDHHLIMVIAWPVSSIFYMSKDKSNRHFLIFQHDLHVLAEFLYNYPFSKYYPRKGEGGWKSDLYKIEIPVWFCTVSLCCLFSFLWIKSLSRKVKWNASFLLEFFLACKISTPANRR